MSRTVLVRNGASRHRRGAMLIWFVLVVLPILFFAMALSTEVSTTLIANRSVRLSAESAAVAGAHQFNVAAGDGRLNTVLAERAAFETFSEAYSADAVRGVELVSHRARATTTWVEYTVTYRMENARLLNWLGSDGVGLVTITERAEICRVGDASTAAADTGNVCQRPETNTR